MSTRPVGCECEYCRRMRARDAAAEFMTPESIRDVEKALGLHIYFACVRDQPVTTVEPTNRRRIQTLTTDYPPTSDFNKDPDAQIAAAGRMRERLRGAYEAAKLTPSFLVRDVDVAQIGATVPDDAARRANAREAAAVALSGTCFDVCVLSDDAHDPVGLAYDELKKWLDTPLTQRYVEHFVCTPEQITLSVSMGGYIFESTTQPTLLATLNTVLTAIRMDQELDDEEKGRGT